MKSREIANLLPSIYQEEVESADGPLPALLAVIEHFTDGTDNYIKDPWRFMQPWRCDYRFVPAISTWVGLGDYIDSTKAVDRPDEHRELLIKGAELARNRGTEASLVALLELLTGLNGFSIDALGESDSKSGASFHFRVNVPEGGAEQRALIEQIVANEKPCYTTAELLFVDQVEKSNLGS